MWLTTCGFSCLALVGGRRVVGGGALGRGVVYYCVGRKRLFVIESFSEAWRRLHSLNTGGVLSEDVGMGGRWDGKDAVELAGWVWEKGKQEGERVLREGELRMEALGFSR